MNQKIKLYSPEYALEEIKDHKKNIIEKTRITESEFTRLRQDLAIAVQFISTDDYKEFLPKALQFCPDPNDIDFLALSLKLKHPLWSNDSRLKHQNAVLILSTKELISKSEFAEAFFQE